MKPMKDKKKILISYCGMISGGSTSALIPIMDYLASKGHQVDLALYRHDFPYMGYIPTEINVLPQIKINKSAISKALAYIFKGYLLKKLLYEVQYGRKAGEYSNLRFQVNELSQVMDKEYDVCIGFMEGWSDVYALSKVKAKKTVTWIHLDYKKADTLILDLEKEYLSKSDCVVCVSKDCQDSFSELFPELAYKTTFIENIVSKDYLKARVSKRGNDTDIGVMEKDGTFKILSVCRLSMGHKGLDRMVWAAKELKDSGKAFHWYIIGDGPDKGAFVNMIRDNGLEDNFILLGFKENPYPYFVCADLMCMPSRYEGKPIVVTEALLLGLPVAVTEYASAKDQIEHGTIGFIVPNEDYTMGSCLIHLMENPVLLENVKQELKSYSIDNSLIVKQIEQLIQ